MIKPKDTENNFRLPRKVKKKLKKGFWLYLPDEVGSSLQANPTKSQEDYTALKQGSYYPFCLKHKGYNNNNNKTTSSNIVFLFSSLFIFDIQ